MKQRPEDASRILRVSLTTAHRMHGFFPVGDGQRRRFIAGYSGRAALRSKLMASRIGLGEGRTRPSGDRSRNSVVTARADSAMCGI